MVGAAGISLVASAALFATQASTTAVAASGKSAAAPSSEIQLFASRVETLGANSYPNSFAGAVLTPAGITDVYVRPSSDSPLINAIKAINTSGYPVDVVDTSRSYAQLNALNARLGAAYEQLKQSGIELAQSWPDPPSGSVRVSIVAPNTFDLSALASRLAVTGKTSSPVTASNYLNAASTFLTSEFGPGITVQSTYGQTGVSAGRTNDIAPFYDGDQITGGQYGALCTAAYAMTSNATGQTFMLTAGHCGSGTWSTQAQQMGNTYSSYFEDGSENDFQTIDVPGGAIAEVWGNGGTLYPVSGQLLPAVGTQITFDGSVTGEVTNNNVTATNAIDYSVYDSLNNTYYNAYPMVQAYNPNGYTICQPGDSGGPVFQRTSGSNVNAVGTIVAYDAGTGECSAEQIGTEESVSNTSLLTD